MSRIVSRPIHDLCSDGFVPELVDTVFKTTGKRIQHYKPCKEALSVYYSRDKSECEQLLTQLGNPRWMIPIVLSKDQSLEQKAITVFNILKGRYPIDTQIFHQLQRVDEPPLTVVLQNHKRLALFFVARERIL